MKSWTFGRKITAGLLAMVVIVLLTAVAAMVSVATVSAAKDAVIATQARNLILAQDLWTAAEWKASELRGYLLSREAVALSAHRTARTAFLEALASLDAQTLDAEGAAMVGRIAAAEAAHQEACDALVERAAQIGSAEGLAQAFEAQAAPLMESLRATLTGYVDHEEAQLAAGVTEANEAARRSMLLSSALALVGLLVAGAVAWVLTRTVGRQVGSAIQHVQSSSTELQTAANQQASGSKEQATAMSEITTTLNELLTTSHQIAESAKRVARIAGETAGSAQTGEQTMARAKEAMGAIRRQVNLIVDHMLDLGKKSQEIGGILEIINELSEQTNILAINATIEAVGAGEAGRRFAVVADEIRKLADRVGGSTKEIRGLIDEVRGAINTTVMTTEGGAKAVDAGSQQFEEVAASLLRIVGSVGTTTEAAQEIELSTKQQATAVEQVHVAIASAAQASRETEASASQTLQTASQLASLSRELMRMIRPQPGPG